MIEISCQHIEYLPEQTNQSMTVHNKGAFPILYKVRTNNIKAVDARPNTGFIASLSSVKITVKRNEDFTDNVKLQFTYTQCKDPLTKDNFKELWAKHEKQQKSKTLGVRILGQTSKQKKTVQKSASLMSNDSADANLFQSVRVSRNKGMESEESQYRSEVEKHELLPPIIEVKKQSQISQKDDIQKVLQEKKTENLNLTNNLQSKQKQLSILDRQLKRDTSVSQVPKCRKFHITPPILTITLVLCFLLGLYIGYSRQSSQQVTYQDQSL